MVELTNADVLIFTRNGSGHLVRHEEVGLDDFDGVVPSVGDRIATMLMDEDDGIAAYLVTHRYRIRGAGSGEYDNWSPWVLVVEQTDDDEDLEIDELVRAVRHEELVCRKFSVAFTDAKRKPSVAEDDDLDRDNSDPAYWTPERKEILRKERETRLAALKATDNA